mmetsp:Transcript_24965/g.58933  ORF Transcript_24965/g.58933 Transcript_24965/m.58933 type:complete len:705 (+) Transcript_24965:49-2163(+)
MRSDHKIGFPNQKIQPVIISLLYCFDPNVRQYSLQSYCVVISKNDTTMTCIRSLVHFSLLLLACANHSTIATTESESTESKADGQGKIHRFLSQFQDRELFELIPCDTILLKIPKEDIAAEFADLIDLMAPEGNLPGNPLLPINLVLTQLFLDRINYGVEVRKMCASCEEVVATEPDFQTLYDNPAFEQYCGKDIYGNDVQHSGLVTFPLEEGGVIRGGVLPGFVYCRATKVAINDVPSEFKPKNIEAAIGVLASIAQGLPSISPDFMGYGSSEALRGYVIKDSYVTSALPLWLKLKLHLRDNSDCNTDLDGFAIYQGYSEGGYAAVAVADGFKKAIAVQPVMVMAGGGPYGTKDSLLFDALGGTAFENVLNRGYGLLLGASYSSTHPGLENFNQSQDMLTDDFRDQGIAWLAERNITKQIVDDRMENLSIDDVFNAKLLSFIRGAIEEGNRDYCQPIYSGYEVGVNDKICESLIQNDLTDTLLKVDYPVVFCHGLNDEVVSLANVPNVSLNPYLSTSFKNSTHREAGVECLFEAIGFIANKISEFVPEPKPLEGGCPSQEPTSIPCPPDETLFLFKKTKGGVRKTKKCSWLASQSPSKRGKICTAKKYQIRSKKPERYAPASVACTDQCSGYCVEEFRRNLFVFHSKQNKDIESTKSCKWLQKQTPKRRAKICSGFVEVDGPPIYGQAKEVCTQTCNSCDKAV